MPNEPPRKLAVAFADVCGSTALYDTLGDRRASRVIADIFELLETRLAPNNGRIVKTIGDEILCTFPVAGDVVAAAIEMQDAVETNNALLGPVPVHIRIGCHFGDVIESADDVLGDTVNVASRVAAMTRARQILATRAVADEVSGFLRSTLRPLMRADVRGKRDPLELFLCRWEQDETLATFIGTREPPDAGAASACLEIRHGARLHRLSLRDKSLVLGRDASCDVVVAGTTVSRLHARISVSAGKFKLSDASSNGTWVRFGEGDEFVVAREDIVLDRSGSLSLGSPHQARAGLPVVFSVELET